MRTIEVTTARKRRFSIASFWAILLLALSAGVSASAGTSQTYYFLVFSNPVQGHEDEYNKWYDQQHAADVVSIPGFVTAQRYMQSEVPFFRVVDVQVPKYLIVYKIVTGDVEAVFAEVDRRLKTGETYLSPTFDRKTSVSYVYQPIGPELKGPGGDAPGAKSAPVRDYAQVVFTAMTEGKESEFNVFYNTHHAPEVVAIPGFVRAQRMMLARTTAASIPPTKYLAMYWIKTSDPLALKQAAASAQSAFTTSPAFDTKATRGYTFRAIGPLLEGEKVRAARAKSKAAK
jgi:hypothetical protein